jgi:hypothetical protein
VLAKDAELIFRISEHHQVFAEQPCAHRRAVGLRNLFRQANRQPVAPRHLPHGRVAFDAAEQLVLLLRQHGVFIA